MLDVLNRWPGMATTALDRCPWPRLAGAALGKVDTALAGRLVSTTMLPAAGRMGGKAWMLGC